MEVKTNAEYHAMQHQIAAATAEVGKVEELILVNMLEADELTAALKTAEAALKSDEAAHREGARGHRGRGRRPGSKCSSESDAERASARAAARAAATSSCSSGCSRPARASPSRRPLDGHCSICHVRLRPQVYNTILQQRGDRAVRPLPAHAVLRRRAPALGAGQAALDAAHARQVEHER